MPGYTKYVIWKFEPMLMFKQAFLRAKGDSRSLRSTQVTDILEIPGSQYNLLTMIIEVGLGGLANSQSAWTRSNLELLCTFRRLTQIAHIFLISEELTGFLVIHRMNCIMGCGLFSVNGGLSLLRELII